MKVLFGSFLTCSILLFIACSSLFGQTRLGASNEAIGNATSTVSNIWSIWNNPAGISSQKKLSGAVTYRTLQEIQSLNSIGLAISLPMKVGGFGFGISKFGDDLFNQQQINISYGNRFGVTELGITLAYHQYHFEGFGNKGVPVISFGGITSITSEIIIGAFIENINQAKISDFQDERIPTIMQIGFSYRPLESISINTDLQKDIDFKTSILVGISYDVIDNFTFRTGFNTNPFKQFFGLDFTPNNIKGTLSYALAHQEFLGLSHQISIRYDFKTK